MKDRQKVDSPPACSPSFHVSLSLAPLCSRFPANININSVIMGSHITSLAWYDFRFYPLCPQPPSLWLPSSLSGQSGQRTEDHHYKGWTWRLEGFIFISSCIFWSLKNKIVLFEQFRGWLQTTRVFPREHKVWPPPVLPQAHGLMHLYIILNNKLQ